uniref:Metastriate one of each protein family n=1 Tax=Rhipicephalus zambeziensis TaxID=60191 RepID=A0A224YNH7_9ACAR
MGLRIVFGVLALLSSTRAAMFYKTDTCANMGLVNMLGVLALLSSAHAAMLSRTDAPCDFTDVYVDDKVFSNLVAKLPESIEYGPQRYRSLLPGLEVGGQTFEGLRKLRLLGSPIAYCSNGTRMVQADFLSDFQTQFWAPWKTCSGDEGRVSMLCSLTRFTFLFRVLPATAEGVKLEFDRAIPVSALGIRLSVEGTASGVSAALEVLSALLPAFMQEIWSGQYSQGIKAAFQTIEK